MLLQKYFFLFSLIVATIITLRILYLNKIELRLSWLHIILLSVIHTLMGVFSAKVWSALENSTGLLNSGVSLFGAVFLLPLFYFFYGKITGKDMSLVFDTFSICLIGSLMCVRTNCIVAGCCKGLQISGTSFHWPTREAEIIFWAIMLTVQLYLMKNKKANGSLYPQMMMFYGIFRFTEDFFRQGTQILGIMHIGHIWSIISFFIGSFLYFRMSDIER